MKITNEFLGFAVLTSPLWLIVIIVASALVVSVLLAKQARGGGVRVALGVFVFLLIVSIPFGDEIAGQIYFNRLCAKEAGARIYHSSLLPAEFWDEHGKAKFIKSNGDLDRTLLANRIREPATLRPRMPALGIDERRYQVVDAADGTTLGEVISFMHWGGWIARNLTTHPSAKSCQSGTGATFWREFYSALFVERPGKGR